MRVPSLLPLFWAVVSPPWFAAQAAVFAPCGEPFRGGHLLTHSALLGPRKTVRGSRSLCGRYEDGRAPVELTCWGDSTQQTMCYGMTTDGCRRSEAWTACSQRIERCRYRRRVAGRRSAYSIPAQAQTPGVPRSALRHLGWTVRANRRDDRRPGKKGVDRAHLLANSGTREGDAKGHEGSCALEDLRYRAPAAAAGARRHLL